MEENYILSVCGRQTVGESSDKIELQAPASYVQRGSSRYITYKEYDPHNPEKHYRTTVRIDENNVVTVMKGGEENHHLILEKGRRHKCEYNTPFGSIMMGVYTDMVNVDLDEHGGSLTVHYSIDIDAELASSNELTITVRETPTEK